MEATLESVWQQARENHANYSATGDREADIRFFALGLAGEAGEVANFVKKRWRDNVGHDGDLRKECADVFAYTIMLADALGMTHQDLLDTVEIKQQVFIKKMEALRTDRSPRGSGGGAVMDKESCPSCGALPCDWTDDPHKARDILIWTIARIREVTGVGVKPMLDELPDAIAGELTRLRAEADERAAIVELIEGRK